MAKWFAEEVSPNTKNRNPGWDEYFTSNTNTVESLVRESIQNSLDAWLDKDKEDGDSSRRPAEVRIYYSGGAAALSEVNYQEYFSEALPHYLAPECETVKPEGPCPFIVIEDYNTTGLTGSLSAKDNQPYFKFFKGENLSNKSAKDLGKWGIGKVVFPISSRIRSFFVFSVRSDITTDNSSILVGQYLLKHHTIDNKDYPPDGWFGTEDANHVWMPETDPATILKFCNDFHVERGLSRSSERGTSIVIPFVEELLVEDLKKAVIENFIHAILSGKLIVRIEVGSSLHEVFDKDHVGNIRSFLMSKSEWQPLLATLNIMEKGLAIPSSCSIVLNQPQGSTPKWDATMIPEPILKSIQDRLNANDEQGDAAVVPITVPFPILYKEKKTDSWFRVFLCRYDGENQAQPRFFRKGLFINKINARSLAGYMAVIIVEGEVATMLNEAEPPSHSEWREKTGRFSKLMKYPADHISFVTGSARQIIHILETSSTEMDFQALKQFFFIPKDRNAHSLKKKMKQEKIEIKGTKKKLYAFTKLMNSDRCGFSIHRGNADFKPFELKISCAYNTLSGKAKYDSNDFDFADPSSIQIEKSPPSLEVKINSGNQLTITLRQEDKDFNVRVIGFDKNRDLKLRPTLIVDKGTSVQTVEQEDDDEEDGDSMNEFQQA